MTDLIAGIRLGVFALACALVLGGLSPAEPTVAAMTTACTIVAWYLVALAALHIATGLAPRRVRPVLTRVRLPGASLLVGVVVTSTVLGATPAQASEVPTTSSDDTAWLTIIDDTNERPPEPVPDSVPETTLPAPVATPVALGDAATTWTVERGESFWAIAEDLLAGTGDANPTNQQVNLLMRRLIDANVDRLVEPDNPDLILPGQVFDIPPPPGE